MRLQIEGTGGRRLGPEIRFAATLVLLFVIAQLADQWIFHHFTFHAVYERAWGRMLRLAGQPFSTARLGLPSSEVAVASAAATALARLFPEGWLLWYALAVGCAFTRVASGAHFMSGVLLAALVGYVSTLILWPRRGLAEAQVAGLSADADA